jgi:hypothetical protein
LRGYAVLVCCDHPDQVTGLWSRSQVMTELREWSYTASHRVMQGLAQELNIRPGAHYRPTGILITCPKSRRCNTN